MGIKGKDLQTYSIKLNDVTSLYNVLFQYRCNKIRYGITKSSKPIVFVDASLIIRSLSCCIRSRVPQLIRICCCFSRAGFNVVVVCDGEHRHHSKRSTMKRAASVLTNKINYMKIKSSLQSLRHQISSEDSNFVSAMLKADELKLLSEAKR